ncbi:MAG TPA: TPM domain-containing protein [Gammaproteobacteria bacterium]|nr:TPM domain-containing protein [Gammaproteobacteria bacterium]
MMALRGMGAAVLLLPALCAAEIKFPPPAWVSDYVGVLSPDTMELLASRLIAHEQETTNQIVVVILSDLQGYPIEDFAYQLGRHWGVGQKDRNNGVVLLVVITPTESRVRIAVGYGLEGALTDIRATDIARNVIVPQFNRGNFEAGIIEGVAAIISTVRGEYGPFPADHFLPRVNNLLWIPIIACLVSLPVLLLYLIRRRWQWTSNLR